MMQMMSPASRSRSRSASPSDVDSVTELLLTASRALVAVAARSLAAVDESVTLPQYRVLVVLASNGPQSMGRLAEALGVHQSTATRVCDRLVAKELVTRSTGHPNRREVQIDLTPHGHRIVHDVSAARRADIGQIVTRMSPALRSATVEALTAFNDAAGEIPQPSWILGWQ
jgi:DNA-binding MarR family transcriptional regulator